MPDLVSSAVFGRDKPAWHRKGVVLPGYMTAREVAEHVKFPHISKRYVFYKPQEEGELVPAGKNYQLSVAEWEDGRVIPLGMMGDRWNPIQANAAFTVCDPVVREIGACYDSAGVLDDGKTFWVLAHLDVPFSLGEDRSERYLLFTVDNCGKGSAVVKTVWVRVECANTLAVALRGKGSEIRISHTGDVDQKIEDAALVVEKSWEEFQRCEEEFTLMSQTRIPKETSAELILDALGIDMSKPVEGRGETIRENTLAKVSRLFQDGRGATAFPEQKGTLWHTLNTVTEYVDHERTTRSDELKSTQFGSGAKVKEKAWDLARRVLADGSVVTEKVGRHVGASSFEELLRA